MDFFVHESSFIDDNVNIGNHTKIWHFSHVSSHASIGSNCVIGQNVFIGEGVVIGDNVKIQNNVSIYTGVEIEDAVFIGPSVVFTNVINPRATIDRKSEYARTLVGEGASLGANATIVCGNKIGRYSFIGAGSVLTCDAQDFGLYLGNPSRLAGWFSKYGERLPFSVDGEGEYFDQIDNLHYQLVKGKVVCRS